ncbi:MAG: bifunctional folylpolyglutamate synthase/dihydrofolate synthase [bacterium]|nr:bifunctional folylpolyglutamate synthase/dihydrofolate synthase [bacterium]
MDFWTAEKHLYSRQMFGIKLGLSNIRKILKKMGNPEKSFRTIHIAGTNGKGSAAAIMDSILRQKGIRTGLFTSPHLVSVRERFIVNGKMIPPKDFTAIYEKIIPLLDEIPCTFFECTTAIAYEYFRQQNVGTAVIETGLGGRYDATNSISPECSVITNIGYDHMEYLGDTLEKITGEKCGIIKKNTPVVSGVKQAGCREVIEEISKKRNSPLIWVDDLVKIGNIRPGTAGTEFDIRVSGKLHKDLYINMPGTFQLENAALALAVMSVLDYVDIEENDIIQGLKKVEWKARFQFLRKEPIIILDVAHNEPGFKVLSDELLKLFPDKKVLLVVGLKDEKDAAGALEPVLRLTRKGFGVPVKGTKGIKPSLLAKPFNEKCIPFKFHNSVRSGLLSAVNSAGKDDIVLCAGSHYTVRALKKVLNSLDRV